MDRNWRTAFERRPLNCEASGPRVRAFAALYHGLERSGRLDGKHRDGAIGQSAERLLSRSVADMVLGHNARSSLLRRRRSVTDETQLAVIPVSFSVTEKPESGRNAIGAWWIFLSAVAAILPLLTRGNSFGH